MKLFRSPYHLSIQVAPYFLKDPIQKKNKTAANITFDALVQKDI